VVGWRFIGKRRDLSLDPSCGWTRGNADVVDVADASKVMAKLNEMLAKKPSCSDQFEIQSSEATCEARVLSIFFSVSIGSLL
jgi:hypothetical protein